MKPGRSIGDRIRREVQPQWDEVRQARVFRRVLSETTPPRRRGGLAATAVLAAAVALVAVWMGATTMQHQDAVPDESLAPMEASPAATSEAVRRPPPQQIAPAQQSIADDEGLEQPDASAHDSEDRVAERPSKRIPTRRGPPKRAEAAPSEPTPSASPEDLLDRADLARRRDDLAEATALLQRFVDEFPRHPDADAASMALARVLEQRGRYGAAATVYEALLRPDVISTIREDARAGAGRVWSRQGRPERGRPHAREYLERNPSGPHARTMKDLLED